MEKRGKAHGRTPGPQKHEGLGDQFKGSGQQVGGKVWEHSQKCRWAPVCFKEFRLQSSGSGVLEEAFEQHLEKC